MIIGDLLGGDNYGIDVVGGWVYDLFGMWCDFYGKFVF